jgi:hypothetical protein
LGGVARTLSNFLRRARAEIRLRIGMLIQQIQQCVAVFRPLGRPSDLCADLFAHLATMRESGFPSAHKFAVLRLQR